MQAVIRSNLQAEVKNNVLFFADTIILL